MSRSRGTNEILDSIDSGTTGVRAMYKNTSGNKSYEEGVDWVAQDRPRFFSIHNTGASDLTIEINEDGVLMTCFAGKSLGEMGIKPYITKLDILATDTFVVALFE